MSNTVLEGVRIVQIMKTLSWFQPQDLYYLEAFCELSGAFCHVLFFQVSAQIVIWVLVSSSKITPPSSPVSLKQQSHFLPGRITVWNVLYCSGFSTQSVPPPSKKAQAQDQGLVLSCPTVCPAACLGHRKHSVKQRITKHAYILWLGRANCKNLSWGNTMNTTEMHNMCH